MLYKIYTIFIIYIANIYNILLIYTIILAIHILDIYILYISCICMVGGEIERREHKPGGLRKLVDFLCLCMVTQDSCMEPSLGGWEKWT